MADELARQGKHGGVVNHTEVLEHLAWVEYIVRNVSWHVCYAHFKSIRHSFIRPLSTQPSNRQKPACGRLLVSFSALGKSRRLLAC